MYCKSIFMYNIMYMYIWPHYIFIHICNKKAHTHMRNKNTYMVNKKLSHSIKISLELHRYLYNACTVKRT